MADRYDCIVMGGGPAGSTTGTLLAEHGHRTLILESARFPRHHIGESLMPQTYFTFKRLGVLDKLRQTDFPIKESVQFVSASGKDSAPYFFADRDPNEWSITWQVRRDEFDKMLLDNAREHGAEVCEGVHVKQVVFEGSRAVGVDALVDAAVRRIHANVIIDATGQSSLLARQLALWQPDHDLKNAAIYSYYRGAIRDAGRNAGATLVIRTPERGGWFWFIPISDDVTSVGIVARPAFLFHRQGHDPLATLEAEIERAPGLTWRLKGAERTEGARVIRDFSYRARRIAGEGWVLVGDAFGFLDPVYSSGVMLALKSGELAADAVHDALLAGDLSGCRLGAFGPRFAAGMHLVRQLVHAYYHPEFSFGAFIRAHPKLRDHVTRLLIGDVFNDEVAEVFHEMQNWIKLPEPVGLEEGEIHV